MDQITKEAKIQVVREYTKMNNKKCETCRAARKMYKWACVRVCVHCTVHTHFIWRIHEWHSRIKRLNRWNTAVVYTPNRIESDFFHVFSLGLAFALTFIFTCLSSFLPMFSRATEKKHTEFDDGTVRYTHARARTYNRNYYCSFCLFVLRVKFNATNQTKTNKTIEERIRIWNLKNFEQQLRWIKN